MITLLLVFTFSSMTHASSEPTKESTPISRPMAVEESNMLLLRLDEINAMDKSELTSAEKKELRKEVKSINSRLTTGGVYVSVGGLIIVLLLLIILL